jgi:predicted TIM-barrel fold metal-dependent hydrolase
MNEITEIINGHCHFMNFDYLPDRYTKKIIKQYVKISSSENLAVNFLARLPGVLGRFARTLMAENQKKCIDNYLKNGEHSPDKTGKNPVRYSVLVPLMMDMVSASNLYVVNNLDGVKKYEDQIEDYHRIKKEYPDRVFPFVMFNPHREGSLELCKNAIENKGFTGIKLYPAMGFFADPERNVFESCRWKNQCVQRRNCEKQQKEEGKSQCHTSLENLYRFADDQKLPITVHSQYDSMQNLELSPDEAVFYTDVSDWERILERHNNIRVNFAHFGGIDFIKYRNSLRKEDENRYRHSMTMRNDILRLMNRYNRKDDEQKQIRVFADTAALLFDRFDRRWDEHFRTLNGVLKDYPDEIIFGTDTPAISFRITDREFVRRYHENIGVEKKGRGEKSIDQLIREKFFIHNAKRFLFGK